MAQKSLQLRSLKFVDNVDISCRPASYGITVCLILLTYTCGVVASNHSPNGCAGKLRQPFRCACAQRRSMLTGDRQAALRHHLPATGSTATKALGGAPWQGDTLSCLVVANGRNRVVHTAIITSPSDIKGDGGRSVVNGSVGPLCLRTTKKASNIRERHEHRSQASQQPGTCASTRASLSSGVATASRHCLRSKSRHFLGPSSLLGVGSRRGCWTSGIRVTE